MTDHPPDDFKPATAPAPELGACEYKIRIALRLPPAAAALLKAAAATHYDQAVRLSCGCRRRAAPSTGSSTPRPMARLGSRLTFATPTSRPRRSSMPARPRPRRPLRCSWCARRWSSFLKRTEELYAQDGTR